jgi:hypothetical protein
MELVKKHIPKADLLSNAGTEISFRLPFEESGNFPPLFSKLDTSKASYGIENYAISVTTLEEVFLKITKADEEELSQMKKDEKKSGSNLREVKMHE